MYIRTWINESNEDICKNKCRITKIHSSFGFQSRLVNNPKHVYFSLTAGEKTLVEVHLELDEVKDFVDNISANLTKLLEVSEFTDTKKINYTIKEE